MEDQEISELRHLRYLSVDWHWFSTTLPDNVFDTTTTHHGVKLIRQFPHLHQFVIVVHETELRPPGSSERTFEYFKGWVLPRIAVVVSIAFDDEHFLNPSWEPPIVGVILETDMDILIESLWENSDFDIFQSTQIEGDD